MIVATYEMEEFRNNVYENAKIYKKRIKRWYGKQENL